MCVLVSIVLSCGSQKQGFKNAHEPCHAIGNNEKECWYNLSENTLRNKIMM